MKSAPAPLTGLHGVKYQQMDDRTEGSLQWHTTPDQSVHLSANPFSGDVVINILKTPACFQLMFSVTTLKMHTCPFPTDTLLSEITHTCFRCCVSHRRVHVWTSCIMINSPLTLNTWAAALILCALLEAGREGQSCTAREPCYWRTTILTQTSTAQPGPTAEVQHLPDGGCCGKRGAHMRRHISECVSGRSEREFPGIC